MRRRAYAHASPAIDGAKLRNLRQRAGLTVTDAAKRIGIAISYLSQIERGVRPTVAPATYKRICEAMDIPEDDLLVPAEPTRTAA